MITSLKEINKEFALARKHFKNGIELARKNIIVGEIIMSGPTEKKPRTPRAKKAKEPKDLPDLDKDGYMNKRGKTDDPD